MYGRFNNVKIRSIGERTNVPDDDVAKLMYYLSCVDTVINYNEMDRLSDYQNYNLLSVDDMAALFKLVLLFNPKIFVDAGIFILDETLLPNDLDNQFFEITDERIGIHVNNEIFIGGRSVKVLKVMACNEDWLYRNYFRPWKNIFETAERYQRSQRNYFIPPPPPKPIYRPPLPQRPIYRPPPPPSPIYRPLPPPSPIYRPLPPPSPFYRPLPPPSPIYRPPLPPNPIYRPPVPQRPIYRPPPPMPMNNLPPRKSFNYPQKNNYNNIRTNYNPSPIYNPYIRKKNPGEGNCPCIIF